MTTEMLSGAQALHHEGLIAWERGDRERGLELMARSITIDAERADFHENLGTALLVVERLGEAVYCLERAVALAPDSIDALNNLGIVLTRLGRPDEAEGHFRHAIDLAPEFAPAWSNLCNALTAQGKFDEAVTSGARAVELDPGIANACLNLRNALLGRGNGLAARGQLAEAEASFRRALEIAPDFSEAHVNLGTVLGARGRLAEAEESYRRALALKPDDAEIWSNLGHALAVQGRLAEAVEHCRRALLLRPEFPEALTHLGNALAGMGALDEAVASYRQALALRPDHAAVHSNLIFTLDFDPRVTSAQAFEERRRWNATHARPLAPADRTDTHDRSPDRRLRIGYVSPDFRRHSAAAAFAPVVLSHDPEAVEVVCYSGVLEPDAETARFRAAASRWRSTVGVSDEALAALILEDGIDILVDLAGHSAGGRLRVFAMRPAPVQITAWGHALGTGLDAMDYFFADRVTVPAELRGHFAEEIVELPALVAYDAPDPSPAVAPLPALTNGAATFGCFNRPGKVTDEALALWAEILRALPGGRLLLKSRGLDQAAAQERILGALAARGVALDRIRFQGWSPRREHLAAYEQVDLALDPFPHGGGVTALDGLWMGVPMITLLGERVPGRMGASFLTTLGLPEFIATSPAQYVALAVGYAQNVGRLASVRAGLRQRMASSPLGDRRAYCRAVESAYRELWQRWCAGPR